MLKKISTLALGGSCHWCTEALFQSLKGVEKVKQGYVASTEENSTFSEAVIVHYNSKIIALKELIEIHLHTHKSTSKHSMRNKYRSAVYTFSEVQKNDATNIIDGFQKSFNYKIITQVIAFVSFKPSQKEVKNYYYNNPDKPLCKTYINPKLRLLLSKFSKHVELKKVGHLLHD